MSSKSLAGAASLADSTKYRAKFKLAVANFQDAEMAYSDKNYAKAATYAADAYESLRDLLLPGSSVEAEEGYGGATLAVAAIKLLWSAERDEWKEAEPKVANKQSMEYAQYIKTMFSLGYLQEAIKFCEYAEDIAVMAKDTKAQQLMSKERQVISKQLEILENELDRVTGIHKDIPDPTYVAIGKASKSNSAGTGAVLLVSAATTLAIGLFLKYSGRRK